MVMAVADIRLGTTDSAGALVESVFARRSPIYAIYRTKDRLLIQFADDPAAEEAQRKALACLGPLRGEFDGVGAGLPGKRAMDMLSLDRPTLDWVALAKGMGVSGRTVTTADDFNKALAEAMAEKGPRLIEVQM